MTKKQFEAYIFFMGQNPKDEIQEIMAKVIAFKEIEILERRRLSFVVFMQLNYIFFVFRKLINMEMACLVSKLS